MKHYFNKKIIVTFIFAIIVAVCTSAVIHYASGENKAQISIKDDDVSIKKQGNTKVQVIIDDKEIDAEHQKQEIKK